MGEFIARYAVVITLIWLGPLLPSMYLKAINEKVVYVRDMIFAILFGPAYFIACLWDLDAVLWKAKEAKK